MPSYGMAEATLAVTADNRHAGVKTIPAPRDTRSGSGLTMLVSNGTPVLDTSIRISPAGSVHALGEEQVGEVCVNGAGVFAGYYNDSAATAVSLQDSWLRTGDLGFVKDGNLYLTGRLKDLLIVHGHNIMPHEIEWLAESATGAGGAERCGAFSVARGADGEQAVVVLEVSEIDDAGLSALAHDIRSRVGRSLGLPLADVVLVKRGQIPKTTSGKVQRGELRRRYLENTLERRF
jgi:acyl-CoA synthetase (AMP-forming)/AMP-acid ligase II